MLTQLDNGSYVAEDDPGEPVVNKPRISITDQEGEFLAWCATGRRVLEIGTGLGVSTRYLFAANELVTCDVDGWVHENVWPQLHEEGVGLTFLENYEDATGPFDLVFIDGEHSVEQTRKDAAFAFGVCRGMIVVHDAFLPTVAEGLEGLGDWTVLQTTHGLAIAVCWRN